VFLGSFTGLLDDSYSLSLARHLDIGVFMKLLGSLSMRAAPEYSPWHVALRALLRVHGLISTAAADTGSKDSSTWEKCSSSLKQFVTQFVTGMGL
jgi:hypothetical protein